MNYWTAFYVFVAFAFGFLLRARYPSVDGEYNDLRDRIDRINGQLQNERQERGRLAKRIAQTETKISKLTHL